MNVHGVAMDPEAAQKAFREYRAAFMADRNRIDGELMRGYKALSEGKTLISLAEAFEATGIDDLGRPKLAIARADEDHIEMRHDSEGLHFSPDFWNSYISSRERVIDVALFGDIEGSHKQWSAALPFIPPQYRPPNALVNYHLLWEAEWRQRAGSQRKDPMLLRHIGGDLFAVVAAWDLTEVEKLVLAR